MKTLDKPGKATSLNSVVVERLSPEAFDLLESEWNDLLSRSRSDSVFLRWEWIHSWWRIFQGNRMLFILVARERQRLVGIAPFYVETAGFFRTRSLRLCSDELAPDYLDLIVDATRETLVLQAFLKHLTKNSSLWEVIRFRHVLPGAILLTDQLFLRNFQADARLADVCPYVELKGSFDEYYARVPGGAEYRRQQRILFDKKSVTHKTVQTESELPEALNGLFTLHEKRKKGQGLTTAFARPDVRRFHEELSRLFLKSKILDLQMLCHNGAPIGVHYGFHYKRKSYFFNAGFNPEWRRSSVGTVLIRLTIEQAFRAGDAEYDFLKGDEGYKALWANAFRREIELTAYNQTLRGTFWGSLHKGRSALKNVRRTFRSLSAVLSK